MPTLLVIDDNECALETLERALQVESIILRHAATPLEASEMLEEVDAVAIGAGALDAQVIDLLRALGKLSQAREHELRQMRQELQRLTSVLADTQQRLDDAQARLEPSAWRDELTELASRLYFLERLRQEVASSRRYNTRLSLALVDIDRLKRINETFGQPAGDRVLREVASQIGMRARETDFAARVGDDEIAVLLPSTTIEGAREFADDVRTRIEMLRFPTVGKISVSIGLSMWDPLDENAERDPTGELLLGAAETALEHARALGRNRVESWGGRPD